MPFGLAATKGDDAERVRKVAKQTSDRAELRPTTSDYSFVRRVADTILSFCSILSNTSIPLTTLPKIV